MQIITRQPGEAVVINGDITVTVVEVQGDEALLDVSVPPGTTVRRGEEKSNAGESEVARQWLHEWVGRRWTKS